MEPFELRRDHAEILASLRHFDAVEVFHGERVRECVGMGTDPADSLHQDQGLDGVSLGGKLFDAAVVVTYKHFGVFDELTLGVESGMNRFLQGGMVRAYRNDITHACTSPRFFSTSSFSGVTMIWPLPCVSSMSSGRKRRLEVSRPSKVNPNSSLISRSGQIAASE